MLNNAHAVIEGNKKQTKINWFEMSWLILNNETAKTVTNNDDKELGFVVRFRAAMHAFCYALVQNWYFQRLCELAIVMGAIGCFLEAITTLGVSESAVTPGS